MKPIVAVVGRPNVGKSTLVNRLAQTSDAIVHESRGVTRDRSYHTADWNGREFTIVDTGGIEPLKSDDVFATSIRDQALAAAEEAAVILFVVDGRTGVTEEDESVARMLKRCDKPVFLLVNKLDNPDRENDSIWEFYSLGIGEPTPLSALHGHGTGDLLDDIVALLPEEEDEIADEFPDALNVAIIGRPNAGKSSLFNRILGADRSIVSNIAGTTRDAIDTVVERNGKHYRMVDTAGIRKKSTVYENIEYYSMVRGLRAIDRADVALLVVDASVGVTEQDQKVMGLAIERGCAIADGRYPVRPDLLRPGQCRRKRNPAVGRRTVPRSGLEMGDERGRTDESRLDSRIRLPTVHLAGLQRSHDPLHPRNRLARDRQKTRRQRMEPLDGYLQLQQFPELRDGELLAAVRAPVFAHVDRFRRDQGRLHALQTGSRLFRKFPAGHDGQP